MKVMLNRPLIVIALMLFMQAATVVHAVEHHEHEHTEHCEAFVTADQAIDYSVPQVVIAGAPNQSTCSLPHFESYTQPLSVYHHSRAPPAAA